MQILTQLFNNNHLKSEKVSEEVKRGIGKAEYNLT